MKKFLLKLSVYIIILMAIFVGINIYYLLNTDDSEIKNVPDNIQICSFGSSHARDGFNYEEANEKYTCFNFGLSSQSLAYDYRILQNYRNKIQNGAIVFITISYFSFFGKPEIEEKDFASKNKRYYKFLPRELIMQYDCKTDFYVNYIPVSSSAGLLNFLKLLFHISSDEKKDTVTNPSLAKKDAEKAYERHIEGRFENGIRIRKQEAFEAFYGIIDLCNEIGARPILVTVPYLHEYTDEIKSNDIKFFDDFYSLMDEIQNKTGLTYYDYAFDKRFTDDYNLFINSDHMNENGAKKFTNILLHEVLGLM